MSGNKTDNGVLEIGTNEILASYQADTPGEIETAYLKDVNEYINIAEKKKKEQEKAHFSMVFDNPLKGFPYNEQYGFDKTLEEGTWAVPDSIKKITALNLALSKSHPMKKPKDADTAWKKFANLVGDDGVADVWYFQAEKDGGDARDPVVDWLEDWGFKLAGYKITHAPGTYVSGMDDDEEDMRAVEETEVEEGFFQNMWKKLKGKGKIKKPKGKDAKAVKVK